MTPDEQLTEDLSRFYADPLGYVMYAFPWDDVNAGIQMVKLSSPWKERYNSVYGPDVWACQFLDDLGNDIKKRNFNGYDAVEPIRYTTASGHGIGKSVMVAWLIKFILDTRPMCKGVVTANTSDQLRTKTWAETGKWHKMSVTSHLYDFSSGRGAMALARKGFKENWRVDAQTCREENSEAFQGLHAANSTPFFIFDEASGIPDKIFLARSGGATDGEPMIFDFGNPTRNSGMFFENSLGRYAHRHTFREIDSRDVALTNKELFAEWAADHGEDSDFFKVKVRGVFPSAGAIQFINSDLVDEAMRREHYEDRYAPLHIGVDVARFGDDETVIYPRIGYDARTWKPRRFRGLDTVQVTEQVLKVVSMFKELGKPVSLLAVDGGGLGAGVVDQLRALNLNPIDVNFGTKPVDPDKYRFRGDEMWGRMRDNMERLSLPPNPDLRSQLTQREYGYTSAGHKIHLETKKDMKKRGVLSPDLADALALTFAVMNPVSVGVDLPLGYLRSITHEYDPLEMQ